MKYYEKQTRGESAELGHSFGGFVEVEWKASG
jgi:hypothetical protein